VGYRNLFVRTNGGWVQNVQAATWGGQ